MSRILSIEDDHQLQFLVGTALFREGLEVHYAFNGQEGYEKILSLNPDLILLDLMIPVMNGIELLKKIKSNKATADIAVIIVTAYGDHNNGVNLMETSVKALGAVEYLRKPFSIADLISKVKNTLEKFPRTNNETASTIADGELRKGVIRADPRTRCVWIKDRLVATLPRKRFELLNRLMEKSGPVSKEALLKELGYDNSQINTLEKNLQRLREDFGTEEFRIKTSTSGYELGG